MACYWSSVSLDLQSCSLILLRKYSFSSTLQRIIISYYGPAIKAWLCSYLSLLRCVTFLGSAHSVCGNPGYPWRMCDVRCFPGFHYLAYLQKCSYCYIATLRTFKFILISFVIKLLISFLNKTFTAFENNLSLKMEV